MEDAHLAVSPMSDGNNSCFAVFDGHGGIIHFYSRSLSCRFCPKAFRSGTRKQ